MSHHCERPAHQFGAVVDAATEARDQDTSGFVETGFALAGPGRIHEIVRVTTLLLFFLQAGHQLDEIAGSKPAVQLVV